MANRLADFFATFFFILIIALIGVAGAGFLLMLLAKILFLWG